MGRLSVISDMDGVIYRGKELIPGAQEFVDHLLSEEIPFLFLTNNSEQTPLDLVRKLDGLGIHGLREDNFITAAIATAAFLNAQRPRSTAYVLGGSGLASELYKVGYSITESSPEYVVVGKTANFSFATMRKAAQLIDGGARFIGTNPDMIDPVEGGTEPAAGAILAAIEAATGKQPYIVGKPNSLMMIYARQMLHAHAEDCVMIGDRMDTDIVGGLEAGMTTALVLSGVSTPETVERFPYRPDFVFDDVGTIDWDALEAATGDPETPDEWTAGKAGPGDTAAAGRGPRP
jgi:NagD protein